MGQGWAWAPRSPPARWQRIEGPRPSSTPAAAARQSTTHGSSGWWHGRPAGHGWRWPVRGRRAGKGVSQLPAAMSGMASPSSPASRPSPRFHTHTHTRLQPSSPGLAHARANKGLTSRPPVSSCEMGHRPCDTIFKEVPSLLSSVRMLAQIAWNAASSTISSSAGKVIPRSSSH